MTTAKIISCFALLLTLHVNAQLIATHNEILIPMRDGQSLSADVYIPNGVTDAEVILVQTPYNKNLFIAGLPLGIGQNLNAQPYIWVIVDWRGFYGSSGAAVPSPNRGEDGYDICEWISQQTWFHERIGTWGPSALGGIQYQTAREQHPNHTCAVPVVAHPHTSYDSYYYGGALEKARLEQLDALGYGLSPLVLTYPYYNAVWQYAENQSWYPEDIIIPTLQIGGWYDHNIDKMLDWYEATRNDSPISVQDEQWLLIGPWVHGGTGVANPGSSTQGELSYPNAAHKNDTFTLEFFAHYLLQQNNGWETTEKITYYEMGSNTWLSSNSTRVDVTTYDELFLEQGSLLGGSLGEGSTTFMCDPKNPSPTIGGATLHPTLDQGPYDQTELDSRTDVITFTSDALTMDVNTIGNVLVDLFVSSDQPDGDITIRLVDQYPDGTNMLVTDGIKRIRFRNGNTEANEAFMAPGVVYPLQVQLAVTNYTWLEGHKIKIYVAGNSSYRWDVNLQNGDQMYQAGDTNTANITIHHSDIYPSKISFPGSNPTLNSLEGELDLTMIYPNPVNDLLTISSINELKFIQILDLNGRIVLEEELSKNSIDLSQLQAGIYTCVVETNKGLSIQKLVKN